MAWPDLTTDAEGVAANIVTMTRRLRLDLTAWRAQIDGASAIDGLAAAERYQQLASYRTTVAAWIAADPAGIAAAYLRRRPALNSFDATARWAELEPPLAAFLTWFQAAWPRLTTEGYPAFQRFGPATGELQSLTVTLAAPAKAVILGRIDAVLAATAIV